MTAHAPHPDAAFATPTIEEGVAGPRDQDGILLRAPFSEALAWDIENEIVSTRRAWLEDRSAWWIAASYRETLIDIVLRSFPSVLLLGADADHLLSRDRVVARQERLL